MRLGYQVYMVAEHRGDTTLKGDEGERPHAHIVAQFNRDIDVRVGSLLAPGGRSEQRQPDDAHTAQIGLVRTQARQGFGSIHRYPSSLKPC